jgi:hypothetical protein
MGTNRYTYFSSSSLRLAYLSLGPPLASGFKYQSRENVMPMLLHMARDLMNDILEPNMHGTLGSMSMTAGVYMFSSSRGRIMVQ